MRHRSGLIRISITPHYESHPMSKVTKATPASTTSPEAAFWNWFVANQAAIAKVPSFTEPIAQQALQELRKVDPRLHFVLGVASPLELITTASGNKEVFPVVQRLVAAAPPIPGWQVIAFLPRCSPSLGVRYIDAHTISEADLSVRISPATTTTVDIEVFVRGVSSVNSQTFEAAYWMFYSALGEYDMATRVRCFTIDPGDGTEDCALAFADLAPVVDAFKAKMPIPSV